MFKFPENTCFGSEVGSPTWQWLKSEGWKTDHGQVPGCQTAEVEEREKEPDLHGLFKEGQRFSTCCCKVEGATTGGMSPRVVLL